MVICPPFEKVGLIFMTVMTFQTVYVLVSFFYRSVLRPAVRKKVKLKELGQWAVVTGATEGLGKAYAFALAREGLDIVLISNSLKKLESVAAEIEAEFRVHTIMLLADLTGPDTEDTLQRLEEDLSTREVGVLVNNMAAGYPHPEYFLDLPHSTRIFSAIISCNVLAVTLLTSAVLPGMAERGRGLVVNLSSTAALIPCPMLSVYAASKMYVRKFSHDLSLEYGKRGVIVQCLTPGYIASSARTSSWMVPSPERYVHAALGCIEEGPVTTAYFPHSLMLSVVKLVERVSPRLAGRTAIHGMEIIRNKTLQRYVM